MTHASHNNIIVIATFFIKSFHHLGSHEDHFIPATIINIKHTTKIIVIIIFVNALIIRGNTFVGFDSSAVLHFFIDIQFHINGKSVLSLIPWHSDVVVAFVVVFVVEDGVDWGSVFGLLWAFTNVHNTDIEKTDIIINKYHNIFFLIFLDYRLNFLYQL